MLPVIVNGFGICYIAGLELKGRICNFGHLFPPVKLLEIKKGHLIVIKCFLIPAPEQNFKSQKAFNYKPLLTFYSQLFAIETFFDSEKNYRYAPCVCCLIIPAQ